MGGLKKSLGLLALVAVVAMGGCGGGGSDTAVAPVAPPTAGTPEAPPASSPAVATLRIGILPDTQGSDSGVALHPMKAILDLYEKSGVDVVLAVGDLVENGTAGEYALWRDLAEKYRGKMTILPIM